MFNYKIQCSLNKYSFIFFSSLLLTFGLYSNTFSLGRKSIVPKTDGKNIKKDSIIGKGQFKLKEINYVAQDSIIYDKINNILHLYGSVKISSKKGFTGEANYFKLNLGDNKIRSIEAHTIMFE